MFELLKYGKVAILNGTRPALFDALKIKTKEDVIIIDYLFIGIVHWNKSFRGRVPLER